MEKGLGNLVEISRYYGARKEFVIAGGGNTSYKTGKHIWVKASGQSLATIDSTGFAMLDREKLAIISSKKYSENPAEREEQVKNDLAAANLTPLSRPSVETSLHDIINYKYVVHMHPTTINGVLCAKKPQQTVKELFGDKVLFIQYIDPGYTLFKEVLKRVEAYRVEHGHDPKVILLQNHGIFVGSDTVEEIKEIYDTCLEKVSSRVKFPLPQGTIPIPDSVTTILPAIRMIAGGEQLITVQTRNNELINHFASSQYNFNKVSTPYTPDIIVYCKSKYIYLDATLEPINVITTFQKEYTKFVSANGYDPKVVMAKGIGLIALAGNSAQAGIVLDVFEDMLKIAWLSENFGGPSAMTSQQINFIDNWEVENYRRSVSAVKSTGRVENRVIVITGAAQGFGAGIAQELKSEGANVVVADLNSEKGESTVSLLNESSGGNKALFVKVDVGSPLAVENLVKEAVINFGGIDVFISNAGILKAGGLDEMDPEVFDLVTRVNYNAYYYCTRAVSRVMKLQTIYKPGYMADIIQVNSKSGLSGSNKNFAYSGGKFGGIGLTQSFALELAGNNIKVNSVCPGNFYEGPLWSDPVSGLFVQYLKAGKVQGAKTIEEVKRHYLDQVPIKRGCTVKDVARAILYLIEQQYETGQALPVTGGQVMLK